MSEGDYSKRLLVVRLSALGDVAIMEPVLRQRAAANPEVLFLVAGPPRLAPLFQDMPNVEYVPTERRQKPRELYRMLSALKPDMVADMHHVLRTIGMDWLFRLNGVPVRCIRKHDARGMATWMRYDRVFDHCGLKGGAIEEGHWSVKPADGHRRVVGVAPFAQHKGKIWPLEKMERLVEILSDKGYGVVLFGSPSEASVLESWVEKYEGVESLAGRYSFEEELKQIAGLDVMVSMDSANMHFASCLGIPVVSIWGATHPCRGFYGWKQDPAWAVQKEMDCRPCSKYGKKPCSKGDYPCLRGIEPIEVMERIESLLNR
ncbi:MAG: glycosyltransferase family 9 protein [Bacteroidales bacterium]|nr:glycosyltransferase family 9 protein [Bacteroidales bacterium]